MKTNGIATSSTTVIEKRKNRRNDDAYEDNFGEDNEPTSGKKKCFGSGCFECCLPYSSSYHQSFFLMTPVPSPPRPPSRPFARSTPSEQDKKREEIKSETKLTPVEEQKKALSLVNDEVKKEDEVQTGQHDDNEEIVVVVVQFNHDPVCCLSPYEEGHFFIRPPGASA